jgi:hypothetical protein
MTIQASCHCGAVKMEIDAAPETITDCNCSLCSRYGVLWAYYSPAQVRISAADGATGTYLWSRRAIGFHHCKACGCVTHWAATDPAMQRMGVNARLMGPEVIARTRLRLLDGADTWTETFVERS